MTDRAQFEAMLEALINDDQQAAKEIFHNIVVGKSREIYESLLEDDFGGEETPMEEEEEEESKPKAKDQGNPYGSDDDAEDDDAEDDDAEDDDAEDDDAEDDAEDDMSFGDDDGEEGGDIEDRVMDLEDALEDLKAEFEQLMADEEHEPEHHDGIDDPSFGGDEMGGDLETELMEYVIPVKDGHGAERKGVSSKTVGSGSYENAGEEYPKSTIRGDMVNNMGGTASNIAQNYVEVHGDAGTKNGGGTQGGLLKPSTQMMNAGNVNVPGNKKAPAYKNDGKGHGAEKKGAKPGEMVGAHTGEVGGQRGEQNKQSTLRPIKK